MSKYETPLMLRIPLPNSDYKFGIHSTSNGKTINIRINNEEHELVNRAAKILEIERSTLIRHCVVAYSRELIKHRENWIKEKINAAAKSDPSG